MNHDPEVTLPAWQSSTAGARIRAALWLAQEIGEGGTFRKAQLRAAFPSVEQIDRRMRELREDGWVFATNREDLALASDELRLVRIGGAVWDKSYRRARTSSISANDRKAAFAADGFACRHCGVAAGEPFADDPIRIAKLSVARSPTRNHAVWLPSATAVSPLVRAQVLPILTLSCAMGDV